MATVQRVRDRGRQNGRRARERLAQELKDARLLAGVSQRHAASVAGLSQPVISRIEHAHAGTTIESLALLSASLGLKLSVKLYPDGSPVRDAGQLRLLDRLKVRLSPAWSQATEMLVGTSGDLRAWDLFLRGSGTIGIDAETQLHDLQALQRRCEAKVRDSGVDRVILLVAATRYNRAVLRQHREAIRSTFLLDTREVLAALQAGAMPRASGIIVL